MLAQSAVLERQGSAIADSPGYGKKADPDFGGGESLEGQSSRFNLGLGFRGHDVVRPHFEKVVRTLESLLLSLQPSLCPAGV